MPHRTAPYGPDLPVLHWPPHPSLHCLILRSPPDCHWDAAYSEHEVEL